MSELVIAVAAAVLWCVGLGRFWLADAEHGEREGERGDELMFEELLGFPCWTLMILLARVA